MPPSMNKISDLFKVRRKMKQLRHERKILNEQYSDIMTKRVHEKSLAEQRRYDQALEAIQEQLDSLANKVIDLRIQVRWQLVKVYAILCSVLYALILLLEHYL